MELSKGQIKRTRKAAEKKAAILAYEERKKKIGNYGYEIKSRVYGDKSRSYQLYKDGNCITPGACWDYAEPLFKTAEQLIEKSKT